MSATTFQKQAFKILRTAFGSDLVRSEFGISTGATDVFADKKRYLPRLDIAVGPFNVTRERHKNARSIFDSASHPFVKTIIDIAARQSAGHFCGNANPRCLLAIEIEFSGSSKLIMGDFMNASMMGLVGLVIGPSNADYMQKIHEVSQYVRTLRSLEKAPQNLFTNVACLDADRFLSYFSRASAVTKSVSK
jgi:hypothetical protein